jgi:hypothetical protein
MSSETPKYQFHADIAGRVRNTKLPTTRPLWPLFEAISNSIHSIQERGDADFDDLIEVRIIRQGKAETLESIKVVDTYPITGMMIVDNGIGFTELNFNSFLTADSDYKLEKGAKGIGRFVCLKAFNTVRVDSVYDTKLGKFHRKFDFKAEKGGIFDYENKIHEGNITGTRVSILGYKAEYQKKCPKSLKEICEKIIEHFLVNFLLNNIPTIRLVEQNGDTIIVNDLYTRDIKPTIKNKGFEVKGEGFEVNLVKLYRDKPKHEIHYCANERDVKSDSLGQLIIDLGKRLVENGREFAYHAYVTGSYLDDNVDSERTDFNHPTEVDEREESPLIITQKDIERGAVKCIENMLNDYLDKVRDEKMDYVKEFVHNEAPQFMSVIKHRPELINSIPPKTNDSRLNMELYRLHSEWEMEVKEKGEKFLKSDEVITDLDQYKKNYSEYIEELNDIGKSNLAKYIVHRKSVIELLEAYLGKKEDEAFMKEDAVHNIFFPIKSHSDEIDYNQQNLWLIDERLSYHSYLSSDKSFKQIEDLDSQSKDRTDLLIFNEAFAFTESNDFSSFTIVEFKRPERDDYSMNKEKDNPVDQVYSYIRTIRDSKAKTRTGKTISIGKNNVPFYCYIVCDFNNSLYDILETREFKPTPDGEGYFRFHETFNAYIEVISYTKLLKDAKKRNKILFDKLNLPH